METVRVLPGPDGGQRRQTKNDQHPQSEGKMVTGGWFPKHIVTSYKSILITTTNF